MKGSQSETQDRNSETGTEAEIVEDCCLLACFSVQPQELFLCLPGLLLCGGKTQRVVYPSTKIINQDSALKNLATA